jgi:hypothetical protein
MLLLSQLLDRVINCCTIVVVVGGLVEYAASFIIWVILVSPIGGAAEGSGNLSTSLSNVARLAAHQKCVWVFNANYMVQSFIMTLY